MRHCSSSISTITITNKRALARAAATAFLSYHPKSSSSSNYGFIIHNYAPAFISCSQQHRRRSLVTRHLQHSYFSASTLKGRKIGEGISLNNSVNNHSNENSNTSSSPTMTVHHLTTVDSTQDEARRLLKERSFEKNNSVSDDENNYFAVSAAEQCKGRGTSGRDWIGRRGNVFVTICIPQNRIVVTPTLLPLKIGCIVATHIRDKLQQTNSSSTENNDEEKGTPPKVAVKWPNDVLLNDGKIAGILIESEYDITTKSYWYLIGIGINVAHAPSITQEGKNRGRHSTCLAHYCSIQNDGVEDAKELAQNITSSISKWVEECVLVDNKEVASDLIVQEWSSWAIFGKEQVLRDKPGYAPVMPIRVEKDGRLRVRRRGGDEVLLCTDYLY